MLSYLKSSKVIWVECFKNSGLFRSWLRVKFSLQHCQHLRGDLLIPDLNLFDLLMKNKNNSKNLIIFNSGI